MKKLNIGCQWEKLKGYINMDINPHCKPDVIGDAMDLPYGGESFDYVHSSHCIEHTSSPHEFMGEVHRVLKPKGTAEITFPFAGGCKSYTYDHKWFMNVRLFHWFDPDDPMNVNCPHIRFKMLKWRYRHCYTWLIPPLYLLGWMVEKILNIQCKRIRELYECNLMSFFPMNEATVWLRKVKGKQDEG